MFRVISRCIKTKNMWQETIILYVILTNKQLRQHIKFLPCSSFVTAPRCIPWPWCASESVTFINPVRSFVSTSVRVIKISPSTKPDSGVTFYAIPLIASNDADSCFGITSVFAHGVKPLLVTLIELQGGLRTNRQLPRFTIQWSAAVLPISNHSGIQGIGIPVNCNKFEQVLNLHTEADLGEWCVPVGGKFGLLWVKPSLPSVKVKGFFVASIRGINCSETTGSPRSKYEHRRTSALLHNIRNIRICMGKNYRFCYLNKKKNRLSYWKCVCYVSPVWSTGGFMAVLRVFK